MRGIYGCRGCSARRRPPYEKDSDITFVISQRTAIPTMLPLNDSLAVGMEKEMEKVTTKAEALVLVRHSAVEK